MTRFWRLDVEGAGHAGVEYFFTAKVEFPKGANLDCKPEGAENTVKADCSASSYYSTTIQNKMVKERQYIEPGKVIEFKDETRFDQSRQRLEGTGRQYLLSRVGNVGPVENRREMLCGRD